MPSQKPRIALTLSPELDVAIRDMAKALGRPASTVLVEMLTELIPQLEGITKMALAVKSGNQATVKRALVHLVGENMAGVITMHQQELELARKGKKG